MRSEQFLPELGDRVPTRGWRLGRAVARKLYGAIGWSVQGEIPNTTHAIAVVAPHTSNWDFVIGVIAMFAVGVRVSWLGKHTLFRWPLGVARTLVEATVLIAGWLLGGVAGAGTLLFAVFIGPCVHLAVRLIGRIPDDQL